MESLDSLETQQNDTPQTGSASPSIRRALLRRLGIGLFAVSVFLFFLFLKLPEARIQNLVIAHLRIIAQEQGLLFSAEKVKFGVFPSPSIKIYNSEFKSIDDDKQTLKISFLKVRPQLLSLIGSTKRASISAELLDGELSGTLGYGPTETIADLKLKEVNLGGATILKQFIPVALAAIVDGEVDLTLDAADSKKSSGKVDLKIKKLSLPDQSLYGFNLPKISVGESRIEATIAQGQITLRNVELGKDIKSDDLVGRLTGDGTVDRILARSKLNAKATFELSQRIMQSIPLLEPLLQPAKGTDGKYSYRLTGPLMALEPRPGG